MRGRILNKTDYSNGAPAYQRIKTAENERASTFVEALMAALALISIGLLFIEYVVQLESRWINAIYLVDLAICILFAIDFVVELIRSKSKGRYLKWHWIDVLAMIPAYAFSFFEFASAFGAGIRSLRMVRLVRFLAVAARIRRSNILIGVKSKSKPRKKELFTNLIVATAIAAFYLIFKDEIYAFEYGSYIAELLVSLLIVVVALTVAEFLSILFISKISDRASRISAERAVKLVFISLALIGVASFVFKELLIFAFSLGIIGLVLSFSLSPIISNLIGWIYINVKKVYSVGDYVEIGEVRGIVSNIGYMTTTLLETRDESSFGLITGRVLTAPNSLTLSGTVSTYSERYSPFVVVTLTFDLAYESDLSTVRDIILRDVNEYLKHDLEKIAERCRIEECDPKFSEVLNAGPKVVFRPEESWIEVKVQYPCPSSKRIKSMSDLTEIILKEFNAQPEVVKFPLGRSR